MKKKIWMCALLLPVMLGAINRSAYAQVSTDTSNEHSVQVDSLVKAYDDQESAKNVKEKDAANLSDLKSEREDTRAKAKEAQRVENDANDAARQSKMAYRQEKKAQKARGLADKQTRKAEKARRKSDRN